MKSKLGTTAVGIFSDWCHAQIALGDLLESGFRGSRLGIVARAGDQWIYRSLPLTKGGGVSDSDDHPDPGVLWHLGIAAGLLPGIGPVIAGGMLVPALASPRTKLGDEVSAALQGLGFSSSDALYLERQFKAGRSLVVVDADERYDVAAAILAGYSTQANSDSVMSMAGRIQPEPISPLLSPDEAPFIRPIRLE